MKYLKTYKLFESNVSSLKENINAALVELNDLGFEVTKEFWLNDDMGKPGYEKEAISLIISKKSESELFLYGEIDDIIMTLIEYIEAIWGEVTKDWIFYGQLNTKRLSWNKDRTNKPKDDKYLLSLHLTLKK